MTEITMAAGGMTAQEAAPPVVAAQPKARGWPRLHLIYFVLALFDLLAIGGGLYLSHRLSTVFEESIVKNEEWSARFVSIWKLSDVALAMNGPGNDVFQSRDVAKERQRLTAAADQLNRAIEQVRSEITANVPPAMASHPLKTLTFVNQAMNTMAAHGNRGLNEYEKGNIERAAQSMALMNRSFVVLKQKLNDSISAVREIQEAYAAGFSGRVHDLKRYEYLLGGGILAIVCCVVTYGLWVGRFMKRRYQELEVAHAKAVASEETARAAAAQMQAINEDVVRLNRELAGSLQQLRDAQDDNLRKGKLAQLGQLTATVAHELRNPLGTVRTSSFLLERKVKGKGLGIEAQLERINNGVERCDGIISQLLDFARTKSLTLDTAEFDDWLVKVVEEEAGRLPEAVAVECRLGLGDSKVTFDTARMSRVLINLMANAAEAMVGKGDDPSKFKCPAPRIVIESRLSARGVEITCADNGPGISAEHLTKVFEPLFTTKSFGTGLGLPAVQKILEQHGGGLEVSSRPGEGAVFTAWWPVSRQQEIAA